MPSIIKNSAIIAGILAIIAYAIYRFVKKNEPTKPISYEDILNKALFAIRSHKGENEKYELFIFPPSKAKLFISENPDYFNNISLGSVKDKELVIWYVQSSDNIIFQEAMISDSISPDFTDAVPMDKVYKKIIRFSNP